MKESSQVVTRFAPSPTGNLHVGSARTALFNYLYAKKSGGTFVLRIEDTDKERSKKEFEDDILKGLEWLRLHHDQLYRQSERTSTYRMYLEKLMQNDKAYISKEEAKDGSGEMRELVRFKNPNKKVTFKDEIRGDVTFDTTELGDFVIARDMDNPLYHFVVVVDDFEMGITHVIRGEDHISNTPRQILIQEAIGAHRPIYAHIPLILAADRSKLSKRNGASSVQELKKEGFLPEAVNNFLALIGWNPGNDQEYFTLKELIQTFSLERIQKGGAIFNKEKFLRINKEHISKLPKDVCLEYVKEFLAGTTVSKFSSYTDEYLERILPAITERIFDFGEMRSHAEKGEYDYFFKQPEYEGESLLWKKNPDSENALKHLTYVADQLEKIEDDSCDEETVRNMIWEYAEEEGRGDVLWPMRYALSGKDRSPDPFQLVILLGRDESIQRIKHAIQLLRA